VVELQAADAERVVAALIGAGDEAVERDGHVACGWCHVNQDHQIDEKSSVGTPRGKLAVAGSTADLGTSGRVAAKSDLPGFLARRVPARPPASDPLGADSRARPIANWDPVGCKRRREKRESVAAPQRRTQTRFRVDPALRTFWIVAR
jgi:hypothetical protein